MLADASCGICRVVRAVLRGHTSFGMDAVSGELSQDVPESSQYVDDLAQELQPSECGPHFPAEVGIGVCFDACVFGEVGRQEGGGEFMGGALGAGTLGGDLVGPEDGAAHASGVGRGGDGADVSREHRASALLAFEGFWFLGDW